MLENIFKIFAYHKSSTSETSNKSRNIPQIERGIRLILISMGVGLALSAIYSLQAEGLAEKGSVFVVSLLISGAFSILGGLLGFLFGIPRTLQDNSAFNAETAPRTETISNNHSQKISYQLNTNLEQISDWLTKILVGVSLTQISTFSGSVTNYAKYASPGLGDFPSSQVYAITLFVFFLICGFLIGYLWTRGYLAGAFAEADFAAIGDQLKEVERKVTHLEDQRKIDVIALSTVDMQLNQGPNAPGVDQESLNKVIKNASPPIKVQIFNQARKLRLNNWKLNPAKMEQSIPIFKSLIEVDLENVDHSVYGQLGFALKDKLEPDWFEAERNLSKAIELRGEESRNKYLFYELNRIFCWINLDPNYQNKIASNNNNKQAILREINFVSSFTNLARILLEDESFLEWLELNNLTPSELGLSS